MHDVTPEQARQSGSFLNHLWDPKTAQVLFTALLFALAIGFVRAAHETLILFLFAILFAYFLAPLVGRLEGPLRGRGKAINAVYLLLGVVLTGLGLFIGPRVSREATGLATGLPSLLDRLGSGALVTGVGQHHHWSDDRIQQVQGFLVGHRADILRYAKLVGAKLAAPAQHIWWLVLIPILSIFFLKDGTSIAAGTVALGRTPDERTTLEGLLEDVNVMLGSYIRSQIILASMTLVAYTLVLSILRVPYAFVLGPVAGILEFIPV
ncbi:MAG TPA: AI-2E family transporter, partial [Acidobacteriaceae bacterium]